MEICEMIVQVESIFENTSHVRVEFLNGKKTDAEIATPENVRKLLRHVHYEGPTKLGGALREKILEERKIRRGRNERLRPLIVSIITDGKVGTGTGL
jgi:hypothetical protein